MQSGTVMALCCNSDATHLLMYFCNEKATDIQLQLPKKCDNLHKSTAY